MAEIITVAALNKYVRSVLESDIALPGLGIVGEISNFTRHSKTGHCYFSLKDEKASVRAVMFRPDAEALAFRPENGMRVVVRGRVTLYERDGTFQIVVDFLVPHGEGAVQAAFEQLKARLEAEGLFAPENKRPLPAFPRTVGLVTSKTGAALQDVLKVARRRCPVASFLLAPVNVQGDAAVQQIVAAIRYLDKAPEVDVIIVARGGGSAEDLWVFNAEDIARAASACDTALVSAIGHETDFTILDHVADVRAPTPSAAAEMALPDLLGVQQNMVHIYTRILNNIQFRLDSCYNEWERQFQFLRVHSPRLKVARGMDALAGFRKTMRTAQNTRLAQAKSRFKTAASLAATLDPYAVLSRGYGIPTVDRAPLRSVAQVAVGRQVDLALADGSLACTVDAIRKNREGERDA